MMKKLLFITICIFTLSQFSNKGFAQNVAIQYQNFDTIPQGIVPGGWSVGIPNMNSLGWYADSSNFSTSAYTNASGSQNLVLRNSDSSGTYELSLPTISTLGDSNISIIWGSRVSSNFLASGSSLPTLVFSIDNGTTWDTIAYTENAANSVWALVNNGTPINFPAKASNQASLNVKLLVNIVNNANGTYRIDDVSVYKKNSVINPNGFNSSLKNNIFIIYPNPATENLHIVSNDLKINSISIFDLLGKEMMYLNSSCAENNTINISQLNAGEYIIRIVSNNGSVNNYSFIKK
jgi:hypothetical protein